MLPWTGIQEFLMVVEAGGFTRASERLGVSASHVSRQVRRLEDQLGVKLLARSTRVVRLTEAGAAYHAKVSDMAAGIEEANQEAAGAHAELAGTIRVSAAGPFAEQRVAPLLASFAAEHPRLRVEIDFDTRLVDLVEQGFDFAIRYGALAESGLIARRLSHRTMICAAAPCYLAARGTPSHPRDLRHHDCLKLNPNRWLFVDPATESPLRVRVSGRWTANNGPALFAAAVAGLGIVYTPYLNVGHGLEDGRLVRILEGYEDPHRSSWLVYPERRHQPVRVRKAIAYLRDALG